MGTQTSVKIPKYEEYGLLELYQVLNSIKGDLYPHVYEALELELSKRQSSNVVELEDCYYALNKEKFPEHAEQLFEQINNLANISLADPSAATREQDPEKIKYHTFWRRFGAAILDGFVVGIPLAIVSFAVRGVDEIGPVLVAYVDQVGEFIWIAYFILMHARYGQTVGKKVTKVMIWDKSETTKITLRQAIIRDIVPVALTCISFVYYLGFGLSDDGTELTEIAELLLMIAAGTAFFWWLLEILTMLFNRKRRALHDFIAGTVVTRNLKQQSQQ